MSARRALITGASGFVGASLARRLAQDGHAVTATCRPGADLWRLQDATGLDVRRLDVCDERAVEALIDNVRPQWTFHLAAHGAYSWQTDTRQIFATNLLGTVNLIGACRRGRACEAFVHAGSSSEYGFKDHAPDEDDALAPASAYAVAKAAATLYGRQAAGAGDAMRVVTLRLYSVYGPYEDPRRLVPALLVRGLRGELPPLVDPDVARDFVCVEDVVRAFLAAAAGAEHGTVYNVGSARQTTIREIVQITRAALNVEVQPQWGSTAQRSWDTTTWVSRTDRIRRKLGWEPRVALDEGFRAMVAWLRGAGTAVSSVYVAAHPDDRPRAKPISSRRTIGG